MSNFPTPNEDFFQEEKLAQTSMKKAGGPYSKQQRVKRRNEVFRLHFEYGYSARKISDIIKINHHTICSDLNFLYKQASYSTIVKNMEEWLYRYEYRLESQRTRLMEQLDKTTSIDKKLSIERLVLDIDEKLANMSMKVATGPQKTTEYIVEHMNRYLKSTGSTERIVSPFEIMNLSYKTHAKIKSLIDEEQNRKKF